MKNKLTNVLLGLWIVSLIALAVVSHITQQDIDKSKVEKKKDF